MSIQLSDHFTYKKLFRFTMPSIFMMIFTSVYGVVDGFFVSNFVGEVPFKAVNLIMPFLMILGTLGFMFGAGGSALVSKTLGEGDEKRARGLFSLFVFTTFALGVIISIVGIFSLDTISYLLGARGDMLDDCVQYGTIILCALPFFMLQIEFQSFMVVAQKPQLSLIFTIVAGVTNMVLDALFIAVFQWGIVGAALATALSQIVGGVAPLIFFSRKNTSLLRFCRFRFDFKSIWQACGNGSSELMSNISMSLVGMLYNIQLLKYAGENGDGVAAYGVLMYINFIFISAFIGYSVGVAPVVGYHFGAKNSSELKGLLRKSIVIIGAFSLSMFILSEILASPMSAAFVGYNPELFALTKRAFIFYSFSFLFSGFAIFGSSFFTALNNGFISALISFMRTLVFQVAAVLLLPLFFEIDGIWLSIVFAEIMAVVLTVFMLFLKRKKYNY